MKTGRRGWLAGIVPGAVDAVAEAVEKRIAPKSPRRRRPPGAALEDTFLTLCTRCDACVDACPHRSIHRYVDTAGELARTPVMRPADRPCHMCEGFPCAAACETGALVVPETLVRLGRVRIREDLCFTFMGPECGACAGLCPTDPPALRMRGTQPEVDGAACVGCGLCIEACPTRPAAIELLPLEQE